MSEVADSHGGKKRILAVFLKFPEPGKVKTRLAADIGATEACRAYQRLVAAVLEKVNQCSQADILAICYDPRDKFPEIQTWLRPWVSAFPGEKVLWHAQCEGDLGARLEEASSLLHEQCRDAALAMIGTDCVSLNEEMFGSLWHSLQSAEPKVVIGPCEDGGYYLIGTNVHSPCLYRDIPWSQSSTLAATKETATREGLEVSELETACDVDTLDEWVSVREEVEHPRPCLFFDRDGVINRSPGDGYVLDWDHFHLQDGIAESLTILRENSWLAIIVTSQRCVGKGLLRPADLESIHRSLQQLLREVESGVCFDGIYAYTETDDCPYLAKPDPSMIFAAAKDFGIDLERSWMIGDADRDIEMGLAASLAGTIRVKGEKAIGVPADYTIENVSELPALLQEKVLRLEA